MRRFIGSILSILTTFSAYAQTQPDASPKSTANCTQVLRLARAVYEQGRLHELETLLKDCLAGKVGTSTGFATVQERVDAYKLLTLSYIYLEEPEKADNAMLGLLAADHFFEINKASDPAEFQALYNTFRITPVLSFGVKIGGTANFAHLLSTNPVGGQSPGKGKYSPGYSIIGGIFVERDLFPKSKSFLKNTVGMAEFLFHARPNKITYDQMWVNDKYGHHSATAQFNAKSSWIDMNLIIRYRLKPESKIDPYIGLGPGLSYLLKYEFDLPQTQQLAPNPSLGDDIIFSTVTGQAVDTKSAYKKLGQSVTALGGIKFRIGEFYLNAEARYQFGLNNLVSDENRFVPDLVYNYQININDYRFSNFVLNVGATIPKFIPKKKKKK
jgi:hypothetical protein